MKIIAYQLLFIIILLCGCDGDRYCTPDELSKFVADPDNGLKKTAQAHGFVFEVFFKPSDFLVFQEMKVKKDSAGVGNIHSKYSENYYFILNISQENREALSVVDDAERHSELVQMMSYRMLEKVRVLCGSEMIYPIDYFFDRTYGLSQATSMMFVFEKASFKGSSLVTFQVEEFGLGVGVQSFRFDSRSFMLVPKMKFDISKINILECFGIRPY